MGLPCWDFFTLPVLRLHKHMRPAGWTSCLSSHDRTPITQTTATFRALGLTTHINTLMQVCSYTQLGSETLAQNDMLLQSLVMVIFTRTPPVGNLRFKFKWLNDVQLKWLMWFMFWKIQWKSMEKDACTWCMTILWCSRRCNQVDANLLWEICDTMTVNGFQFFKTLKKNAKAAKMECVLWILVIHLQDNCVLGAWKCYNLENGFQSASLKKKYH